MFTTIHALLLVAAAANIFCITENVFALNRMPLTIMALSVFVNVCFIFTLAANVNHEFFHVFSQAILFILLVLSATFVAKEIHEHYMYILKLAARCVVIYSIIMAYVLYHWNDVMTARAEDENLY
jgi:hypothetical protein